jgi:hypothetical protein
MPLPMTVAEGTSHRLDAATPETTKLRECPAAANHHPHRSKDVSLRTSGRAHPYPPSSWPGVAATTGGSWTGEIEGTLVLWLGLSGAARPSGPGDKGRVLSPVGILVASTDSFHNMRADPLANGRQFSFSLFFVSGIMWI